MITCLWKRTNIFIYLNRVKDLCIDRTFCPPSIAYSTFIRTIKVILTPESTAIMDIAVQGLQVYSNALHCLSPPIRLKKWFDCYETERKRERLLNCNATRSKLPQPVVWRPEVPPGKGPQGCYVCAWVSPVTCTSLIQFILPSDPVPLWAMQSQATSGVALCLVMCNGVYVSSNYSHKSLWHRVSAALLDVARLRGQKIKINRNVCLRLRSASLVQHTGLHLVLHSAK